MKLKTKLFLMLSCISLFQFGCEALPPSLQQFARGHKHYRFRDRSVNKSVLIVVGTFPKLTETFVLKQVAFLIDAGFEVDIYPSKERSEEVSSPVIEAYRLRERIVTGLNKESIKKYGIILCQFGTQAERLLKRGLVSDNAKLVVCLRGCDVTSLLKRPKNLSRLIERADLILPVCDHFRKIFINKGCDPEKIVVLHSAVNCNDFCFKMRFIPQDGSPIKIVTVARLIEKKGLEDSISAVAQLVSKYPQITYKIVGETKRGHGHYRGVLEKQIESLNMQDHITLIGAVQHSRVKQILEESHIFVLSSRTPSDGDMEGIPCSIYEAMAAGLPVVSTFHSGIPEIIVDGVHGLLAPERDVAKIAEHLEFYIKHPEQAQKIGQSACKRVKSWSSCDVTSKQMSKLFEHLVSSTSVVRS